MDINEERYSRFSIVKEMFEVINLMKNFDANVSKSFVSLGIDLDHPIRARKIGNEIKIYKKKKNIILQ